MTEGVVFGYAVRDPSSGRREKMAAFASVLERLSGIEVVVHEARTYEELSTAMHGRRVDLAWLPPIPFIALEQRDAVVALVSLHRGGQSQFHSALIVRASSPIRTYRGLHGKRAVWVDPYSASGYVVPRIELEALGVDPRTSFAAEKFVHSHEAVVRAVVDRTADFGATYAGLDELGAVVRGPWIPASEKMLRALYTFSAIPGDVIAARKDVPVLRRDQIAGAFLAASDDATDRALLRELFRADECQPWWPGGYERLRAVTRDASSRGLLGAREHGYE